jgi:hypothetical protein
MCALCVWVSYPGIKGAALALRAHTGIFVYFDRRSIAERHCSQFGFANLLRFAEIDHLVSKKTQESFRRCYGFFEGVMEELFRRCYGRIFV